MDQWQITVVEKVFSCLLS